VRAKTRVKSKADLVADAELKCSGCQEWKPVADFPTTDDRRPGRSLRYVSKCFECFRISCTLYKEQGGSPKLANTQEVREFLAEGKTITPVAVLKQANHPKPKRKRRELTLKEKRLAAELRAAKAEADAADPQPEPEDLCYLVGIEGDDTYVKIGHTINEDARLSDYQAGNPRKLKLLALLPGGEAKEKELHTKFMAYHTPEIVVGEWFRKSPAIMNEFAAGKVT
jgi:hypothetical protein